ncbi:hypothetical protein E2542_SST26092 [Spatholobus suberectus]|nr:hypothetical protein E2542_SST26092 [Spatholobus suberectus]
MSKRARSPRLELQLNLSPPRSANSLLDNPSSEFPTSSSLCLYSSDGQESCVSSEADEEIRAMRLVGCLRCLMYVLFSKDDPSPKCPKCRSTALLDVLNNKQNTNKTTS